MTPAKNLRNLRVFFINYGDGKLVKEPEIVSNSFNRVFTEVPQRVYTQVNTINTNQVKTNFATPRRI